MCLTIKTSNRTNKSLPVEKVAQKYAKVADTDMLIYKVLKVSRRGGKSTYKAFVKGTEYTPGYEYYQTGSAITDRFTTRINYGNELQIDMGLHAFNSYEAASSRYNRHANHAICEFIIPKGSTYFVGDSNDVVSDRIIFVQELEYVK